MDADEWIASLQQRHRTDLTPPEFLKAVRALSARYVERRHELRARSPLDSAGKRAAFAAFYAPLHFLVVQEILTSRRAGGGSGGDSTPPLRTLIDLGCGTGVGAAAWARALPERPDLIGIDVNARTLLEASWNWRQLGLTGRGVRDDLVRALERLLHTRRHWPATGIIAAWSVNELDEVARARLLPGLLDAARRGATVLIVEPLAGSAAPWWPRWEAAFASAGGHASTWTFREALPDVLRRISDAAGFRRDRLTARTIMSRTAGG